MFTEITILGSDGMLGKYLERYFQVNDKFLIRSIPREKFDVMKYDISYLKCLLTTTLPEKAVGNKSIEYSKVVDKFVINCIAKMGNENDKKGSVKDYFYINSIFPHKLSTLCKVLQYKLIHISTNSVFNMFSSKYPNDKNLLDEMKSFPNDKLELYSFSKSLGEPDDCYIIRTSIIGEELKNKRNLIEKLKRMDENKENIKGFRNDMWNGITCLQLAKEIEIFICKLSEFSKNRILHLTSETVSKHDLILDICKVYGLKNLRVEPEEQPVKNLCLSGGKRVNKTINEQLKELYEFKLCL